MDKSKPKPKFILHDDIAGVVRDVVDLFDAGKIEGLMVIVKVPGEIRTITCEMSYIEKLGAIEMLRDNIKDVAAERDD